MGFFKKALKGYVVILLFYISGGWLVWSVNGVVTDQSFPVPIFLAMLIVSLWVGSSTIKFLKTKHMANPILTFLLCIVGTLYAVGETENILSSDEVEIDEDDSGYGFFNGPCAEFDPIRGYRWKNGCHRTVKLTEQTIVYDNTFCINNVGIYSSLDYQPQITGEQRKRYIILGDSFTAAEFLKNPLCERLNQRAGNKLEYYTFAVDGGGVLNWYQTFFNEIVPTYEFDGLIINVFANDLNRDFFTMHHLPEQGYTSYLDELPKANFEFVSNILTSAESNVKYLDDDSLDLLISAHILDEPRRSMDLKVLKAIILSPLLIYNYVKWQNMLDTVLIEDINIVTEHQAMEYYGEMKWKAINEILNYCVQNEKRVILTSIPYKQVVEYSRIGKVLKEKKFLELLVNKYETDYLDGYKLLELADQKQLNRKFLVGDDHWSQEGSDDFAEALEAIVREE